MQTEKEKIAQKKYRATTKYKETKKRYEKSDSGKATRKRYSQSEKCKITRSKPKSAYANSQANANRRYNIPPYLFRKLVNGGCQECGFKSGFVLDFHHKDNNHKNNLEDNIMYLCPNCHAKKHRRTIL